MNTDIQVNKQNVAEIATGVAIGVVAATVAIGVIKGFCKLVFCGLAH